MRMLSVGYIPEDYSSLVDYGAPTRGWLRLQAPTLSINLTKQGYCLILVPATGVNWSTIWYTV